MRQRLPAALVGILALSLAACGILPPSGGSGVRRASETNTSSPAGASSPDGIASSSLPTAEPATPVPGAAPSARDTVSPFTGRRGHHKSVLAVKIDNVTAARPQTGHALADVVYMEPVEGGLSRLLAVYSGHIPKTVGPVRSARISNITLLRQYGKPALAYSGAHPKLVPLLRKAHLVTLPPTRAPSAYYRGGSHAAPHNLYARPKRLLDSASRIGKARDIGFRFGPAPAGGTLVTHRTVSYAQAAVDFRWSGKRNQWLVSMDGSPLRTVTGRRVSARTVVVQYARIRPSRFKGPLGLVTPHVFTVGSGPAVVLRGGKAYQARWSRPKRTAGTTFTTRSGAPMTFARGPVWIVFQDVRDR